MQSLPAEYVQRIEARPYSSNFILANPWPDFHTSGVPAIEQSGVGVPRQEFCGASTRMANPAKVHPITQSMLKSDS